jgi:TP901 family phage tail tape measure protein
MPIGQSAKIIIVVDSNAKGGIAGLKKVQKSIASVQKTGKGASASLNQFGAALNIALSPVSNFGVALRQLGQALQGISFLTTAFISIPLAAALREISTTAIEYESALVRAQKTTGLFRTESKGLFNTVQELDEGLRDLAKNVATPLETLGELAEQAGQLGVRGTDNILKFVRVAEILGQTTDIAAKDALETFGRLASALGVETERAGEFMLQLANTVNYLENTTTASASNIATGMRNAISAAAGFKIAAADLSAFVAVMYQSGINAREAGTAFSRMAQYVAQNVDDLATMTGLSVAQIRDSFDTDFVGGLIGVIEAIGNVESEMEQMAIAGELFGQRASRGIVLMANNLDTALIPKLEEARKEFNEGSSIIDEYVLAMASTEAQIGILQNNLRVLAVTLGDTFLPIVNTLLKYVVPAVQMVTEAFAALPEKVKLSIFAGAAFLAVLGPLTMILGTLLFSIGIATSGLINLVVGLAAVGTAIPSVISTIAALGLALVGLSVFAEDAVLAMRDKLEDISNRAVTWGQNIVASLARGMLKGAIYVINAAIAIGNAIARFFRSFSPPKEGALKDILNWGKNLIETFIEGFSHADFSAIEDVTNMISRYFRDLATLGIIDEKSVIPNILNVRHAFVELVDEFKKTGEISDIILDGIVSDLGDMGTEMAEFLKLQLKVNAAQQAYDEAARKLREIRDLREDINRTYDKEVRAIQGSGKPLLEQLSNIVDAREVRDDGLAVLDDQEAEQREIANAARRELDIQRDLLNTQEGLIGFYLDEVSLLAEQQELMDRLAKKSKEAAGSAEEFAGALAGIDLTGGIEEFDEAIRGWDELISGIDLAVAGFDEGRRSMEAFFSGLSGEFATLSEADLTAIFGADAAKGFIFGRDLRQRWDKFVGTIEDIKEGIGGLRDTFKDFDIGELEGVTTFFDSLKRAAPFIVAAAVGLAAFVALLNASPLKGLFDLTNIITKSATNWAILTNAFSEFVNFIGIAVPVVAKLAGIAIIIAAVVVAIIQNFDWLKDRFTGIWQSIVAEAETAGLATALQDLGASFSDLWKVISPILAGVFWLLIQIATVAIKTFTGALAGLLPTLVNIFTGIVNILAGAIGTVSRFFTLIYSVITGDTELFKNTLIKIIGGSANIIKGIMQVIAHTILGVLRVIVLAADGFIGAIASILGLEGTNVTENVTKAFEEMANGVNEWISKAKDWVVTAATKMWEVFGPILRAVGIEWGNLAKETAKEDMLFSLGIDYGNLGSETTKAQSAIDNTANKIISSIADIDALTKDPLTSFTNGFWNLNDTLETVAGNSGGYTNTFLENMTGMDTETQVPLDNLLRNWQNVNLEIADTTEGSAAGFDTYLANLLGLSADSEQPLSDMALSWLDINSSIDEATEDSGKAFDQYNNAISGVSAEVMDSIDAVSINAEDKLNLIDIALGTLSSASTEDIGIVNTNLGLFDTKSDTVSTDVITDMNNIMIGVDDLNQKFDEKLPPIYGPGGFLEQFRNTFDSITSDIAGEDGFIDVIIEKMEELGFATYGEGGEFDGLLGAIKKAWHELGSYVGGVIGTLRRDVDNLLGAWKELQEKGVTNSYIPDLAKGVVKWMSWMSEEAFKPIIQDTGDLQQQMQGLALSAPTLGSTGLNASNTSDSETFAYNSPLIHIDKMIVPNQAVAKTFAKEISDQLARKAGWRRTGS